MPTGTIRNRKSLVSFGNEIERSLILDCLSEGVKSVHPANLVENELRLRSSILFVNRACLRFDLTKFRRIIVIGGGKASGYLAQGLEQKLGRYINEGFVNILKGTKKRFRTKKIVLNEASHPVPDASGMHGTEEMLKLLRRSDNSSLIICLISGGGSSLIPLPAKGITLEEEIQTTELLLRSGANIDRVNCVRKHISGVKGGQLAREGNGATFVSLIISDVIGDHLESIASGPTVADPSTFLQAKQILVDLKILDQVPYAIRNRIESGSEGRIPETPKPADPIFSRVSNVIIGSNKIACNRIRQMLREKLGGHLEEKYLGSKVEGEASVVAKKLVSKSRNFRKRSSSPYCALVWGGETTVTVRGNGIGGRNQEEALSALESIGRLNDPRITMGFLGTDGIDGMTHASGALIDLSSYIRAKELDLSLEKYLKRNDSNTFFKKLGKSLILTGATGTNVNDVGIGIITKKYPMN